MHVSFPYSLKIIFVVVDFGHRYRCICFFDVCRLPFDPGAFPASCFHVADDAPERTEQNERDDAQHARTSQKPHAVPDRENRMRELTGIAIFDGSTDCEFKQRVKSNIFTLLYALPLAVTPRRKVPRPAVFCNQACRIPGYAAGCKSVIHCRGCGMNTR